MAGVSLLLVACGPSRNDAADVTGTSGSANDETGDGAPSSGATTSQTEGGSITSSTAGDTGQESTTSGLMGCENGCVAFSLDCSEMECGGLSPYDENGCVRPNCAENGPEICGDGEVCYIAQAFGGCVSGGWSCGDDFDQMQCICGGSGDCGWGVCVPLDLHPEGAPGPSGPSLVESVCTRAGEAALAFTIGSGTGSCNVEPVESVELVLDGAEPGPGLHHLGPIVGHGTGLWSDGAGTSVAATFGFVAIDAWEDAAVTGSYYIWLEDGAILSGTFQAVPCLIEIRCG